MKGMKFPGMGGLGNMQGMLQKVQKMQAEMQKVQAELQARTFESTAGGGAVKVTVTGKKELTGVLLTHTDTEIEVQRIIKGKEEKNPFKIERKLIAVIRPHIDF